MIKTKKRLCSIISIFFPKVFNRFPAVSKDSEKDAVCIKRFREDYGMYQKIPRRLRHVSKDSEKITVCIKRFREDYGMYYHQERGSHDDDDDDDDFIS